MRSGMVVLESKHFFRKLHRLQTLSAVHPSGAALASQSLKGCVCTRGRTRCSMYVDGCEIINERLPLTPAGVSFDFAQRADRLAPFLTNSCCDCEIRCKDKAS